MKDKEADLDAAEIAALNNYKGSLDNATKFIPGWVKIVVAIAGPGHHRRLEAVRNIALAWVLTLPAAMALSGTLYCIFSHLF